jgi:predicted RNase H-like nuclease
VPANLRHVLVAGVDGCKGGWVVVLADAFATRPLRIERVTALRGVVAQARQGLLGAVGIDMPIGLPDAGVRESDAQLRRFLGPRHASVFSTPPRAVLAASTYPEALALARDIDGRGISKQAFNLLPKVRELDALIDPSLNEVIVEVHPESSFAAMAGAPLASRKKQATGRLERIALLEANLPGFDARALGPIDDDVLDACAAAWSAARVARGEAMVLGDSVARDQRGLRMVVAI